MGGLIIGPFSVRIYMSIVILLFLILFSYRYPIKNEIILYLLYIIFYWMALVFNNEISEIDFAKYFFGRYFICLIAFYATYSLIKNQKMLVNLLFFFIGIGIINGIISYSQFIGSSWSIIPAMLLNPTESAQERLEIYASIESGLGLGVVGLFGNIVRNGYFSAVFAILSLYLYEISGKRWQKISSFLIMIFLFYTVFLTQQRFVFVLTALFYLFYFYKNRRLFYIMILLLISTIVYFAFYNININTEKLGRISNLTDTSRLNIYSLGLRFIFDNFFFGGQNEFGRLLTLNGFSVNSAHNFFLNAFIYSGVIGAIFVIALYFKMLIYSIQSLLKKNIRQNSAISFFIAGALTVFLLNSLTHNLSLVTGEEFIWVLYALLIKSREFGNSNQLSKINFESNSLSYQKSNINFII